MHYNESNDIGERRGRREGREEERREGKGREKGYGGGRGNEGAREEGGGRLRGEWRRSWLVAAILPMISRQHGTMAYLTCWTRNY